LSCRNWEKRCNINCFKKSWALRILSGKLKVMHFLKLRRKHKC